MGSAELGLTFLFDECLCLLSLAWAPCVLCKGATLCQLTLLLSMDMCDLDDCCVDPPLSRNWEPQNQSLKSMKLRTIENITETDKMLQQCLNWPKSFIIEVVINSLSFSSSACNMRWVDQTIVNCLSNRTDLQKGQVPVAGQTYNCLQQYEMYTGKGSNSGISRL